MHCKLVKCASVNQGWWECLSQPRQVLFSPQADLNVATAMDGEMTREHKSKQVQRDSVLHAARTKFPRLTEFRTLNVFSQWGEVFCFCFFTFRCVRLAWNQHIQLHSQNNPITSQRRVQWVAYCQWIATLCISLWRYNIIMCYHYATVCNKIK